VGCWATDRQPSPEAAAATALLPPPDPACTARLPPPPAAGAVLPFPSSHPRLYGESL
jgi:hypothetical protein